MTPVDKNKQYEEHQVKDIYWMFESLVLSLYKRDHTNMINTNDNVRVINLSIHGRLQKFFLRGKYFREEFEIDCMGLTQVLKTTADLLKVSIF